MKGHRFESCWRASDCILAPAPGLTLELCIKYRSITSSSNFKIIYTVQYVPQITIIVMHNIFIGVVNSLLQSSYQTVKTENFMIFTACILQLKLCLYVDTLLRPGTHLRQHRLNMIFGNRCNHMETRPKQCCYCISIVLILEFQEFG